uniref:uncharacterized protein LOC122582315 n=1 Tax=Erigeron canadensis TaxID=72917 RepID=UPI001CB97642|nr:uncharacterized protein LOC122582315 [Erigeron canadensis]
MNSDHSTMTTTTTPAGKDNHVAVSVNVNNASPPPPSFSVNPRFVPFYLSLYSVTLLYLVELALVRMKFDYDKVSPLKTHTALMIMSIVSMSSSLVIGIVILALNYWVKSIKDIHFLVLVSICFVFECLASFSLLMVFCFPQNLIWIGYLALGVFLAIIVALVSAIHISLFNNEKELRNSSAYSQEKVYINYSVLFAPFPSVLMLHAPDSLNWIKLWVIGVTWGTVATYNGVVYLKSMYDEKYAPSLKASLIQQDSGKSIP